MRTGRGEPQQLGSHSPREQQVGRGGTVVQERSAAAAGRRDHVGQPAQTEKRLPSPADGQIADGGGRETMFFFFFQYQSIANET